MNYTYDDFLSAANNAGMLGGFSKFDLETAKKNPEFGISLLSLKKDAAGAVSDEARVLAETSMNQLRKSYGNYTLGNDGSYQFAGSADGQLQNLLHQSQNYAPFRFDQQAEVDKLQQAVMNPESFQYDETKDPLFSSYRKTYLREGDRAAKDALAAAAAANGGQISTAALAAAQQAQNYYNAQLADIIPTLRQNALNEHLTDLDQQENALNVLLAEREAQRQNWQTGFDVLQKNIANLRTRNQEEYSRFLETQTLADNAVAAALEQYQSTGYATPEIAAILGVPVGAVQGITNGTTDPNNPGVYAGWDNEGLSDNAIAMVQASLGVDADGKWGAQSRAATGGLSAKQAYDLWNKGQLTGARRVIDQQGWTAPTEGVAFDFSNLVSIAPMGMNAEQIQKALNGDPELAPKLAEWLVEMEDSGKLQKFEANGKTKFMWKV